MLGSAFSPQPILADATRWRAIFRGTSILSMRESIALAAAGMAAACAVALVHHEFRIPGHAILRAALPMVLGLAVVPRRWSGSLIGAAAALTTIVLAAAHVGQAPLAAVASMLALGPALDLATRKAHRGRTLYLRFAVAGAAANLIAFAVRWAVAAWHLDGGSGGRFSEARPMAFVSFLLCGAVAGLIAGAIGFRFRGSPPAWDDGVETSP